MKTILIRDQHRNAKSIFTAALKIGFHLCFSGQIIREYLAVATRDVQINGLGMVSEEALLNIENFKKRMTILEETEDVTEQLLNMVRTYRLSGKRIHDANIAATMKSHSIVKLATENIEDFKIFSNLTLMKL